MFNFPSCLSRRMLTQASRVCGIFLASASACACAMQPGPSPGPTSNRYELACDSSDTRETSTMFCMRLDTSNGDIKRIDLGKARVSDGSTMGAEKGPGAYQIVCDSTDTETQSEFHCVRLDRVTGEVLVVGLAKLDALAQ